MPGVTRTSNRVGLPPGTRAPSGTAHGLETTYLVEGIDDQAPDPGAEGGGKLFGRLVVAVEDEALTGCPAGEGDGQLAPGRDVEGHVLFQGERRHRLAQEGLRRIGDAGTEPGHRLAAPRP